MNQSIAVLIPCLNEELTIAKVVNDFQEALPSAKIYVYDNDSDDNTLENARLAGAIVWVERRRGKGNVIRRMLAASKPIFMSWLMETIPMAHPRRLSWLQGCSRKIWIWSTVCGSPQPNKASGMGTCLEIVF